MDMTNLALIRDSLSKLQDLDWDFQGDRSDSPFADLHFHPGRFVPQIPAALIGTLTSPAGLVLDPFCGAGTTLVEAQRLGRNAIGIDLNPVACLVSRAKTLTLSARYVEAELFGFLRDLAIYLVEDVPGLASSVPKGVQQAQWYHPETGMKLARIWAYINSLPNHPMRDIALFCFSASLMSCCGETRTWGYVCDNVRPLEHRYVDAHAVFVDRAEAFVEALYRKERRSMPSSSAGCEVAVQEGDAVGRLRALAAESVDLVVTSPPYFGVVDYVKAQRLSFEWFGLEIEHYRRAEIGARSKRHRATAHAQYLDELAAVVAEVGRVLKTGHVAAFVVGESGKRESTLGQFSHLLDAAGLGIEVEITRQIGISRRQPASLASEQLLICTKR